MVFWKISYNIYSQLLIIATKSILPHRSHETVVIIISSPNRGDSTCLQVDIFMEKVLLNRLFTSGAYRDGADYLQSVNYKGSTDCTQSVKYSQITQ